MDKTTITEVATGTALLCGAIDSAIDGRRIRRLEKEAIKQRKRLIASTAIGGSGVVGAAFVGIAVRRNNKSLNAAIKHQEEQIDSVKKNTAILKQDTENLKKELIDLTSKYDGYTAIANINARLNAVGLEGMGASVNNMSADVKNINDLLGKMTNDLGRNNHDIDEIKAILARYNCGNNSTT